MNQDEFDLIKTCVRGWRRRYRQDSDEEYYGVAWEHLERARARWDGRGNWMKFARQRIIYGLMSEYRSNKQKMRTVAFDQNLHTLVREHVPAIDYIDEVEKSLQLEVYKMFYGRQGKGRKNA